MTIHDRLLRRVPGIAWTIAILFVYMAFAYGNILFGGKSLVYSNNYNPIDSRFTADNYGPEMIPASVWHSRGLIVYPNWRDPGATWWQWEPGGEYLRQAIADREFPLWNPYVGAGAPAMANLTPAYFFPPYLVLVASGNTVSQKNAYFLLVQLVSALCVYLLLRRHAVGWAGGTFGAIAWMASGGMVQNVGSFIGQTAACIPIALYFTVRFVERPSWLRAGGLAVVYAAVALASFPPVLVIVFGFAAGYFLTAVCLGIGVGSRSDITKKTLSLRYCVAVFLSLGLVAWYYVPALAASSVATHALRFYQDAGLMDFPLRALYQILSPTIMGGADIYQADLVPGTSHFHVFYAGIITLSLAALARPRGNQRPLHFLMTLAAVLIGAKIVGMPPVQWLGYVPGLNTIHFAHYFGIGINFSAAVLAGLAINRLLHGERLKRRELIGMTLIGGIILCSLLPFGLQNLEVRRNVVLLWLIQWGWLVGLFGALMLCLALGGLQGGRRSAVIVCVLLGGLLVLEGVSNTHYPRQVRWDVWRNPPQYIEALQQRGPQSRVLAFGRPSANTNAPFGISSVDSLMTFNSPRVFEIYRRYIAPKTYLFLRGASRIPPAGVMDAAGIDVVSIPIGRKDLVDDATSRGFQSFYRDGYVTLLERESPGRCFFTSDFRVFEQGGTLAALPALTRRQVLLESEPIDLKSRSNTGSDARADIVEFGRNSYAVEVHSPREGFVYCADSHFPGWSATVNGDSVAVYRANHAFRAVEVPAGDVRVRFTYRPPGLRLGLTVSALSTVVVLLLLGSGYAERRWHPSRRH